MGRLKLFKKQTIAEVLEAGKLSIVDRIIGERSPRLLTLTDTETYSFLAIERVFCTASGGFILLARPQNKKDE